MLPPALAPPLHVYSQPCREMWQLQFATGAGVDVPNLVPQILTWTGALHLLCRVSHPRPPLTAPLLAPLQAHRPAVTCWQRLHPSIPSPDRVAAFPSAM